jgi:SNF2 family DNA or RNA helicase
LKGDPAVISISYDALRLSGRFERVDETSSSSVWDRLKARAIAEIEDSLVTEKAIELPWSDALNIVREFGTRQFQQRLHFRFAPIGDASQRIKDFVEEIRRARLLHDTLRLTLSDDEILERLRAKGFTKRELKPFQLRDLRHLLSLPHGANFSVPGAGKTTVTFALHLLVRQSEQHFFVVGPKSSFPAWISVVSECLSQEADDHSAEAFTLLDGNSDEVERTLRSGATRFLISYDLMIRQQQMLAAYFARQPVHLVLDESHRMKAGLASRRGAFLLGIANLPARRDILTGTPMPHNSEDLASQLSFLWPGHGLDSQIERGLPPRNVLGTLYVRTTKQELGLKPAERHFYQIEMAQGQMALYGVIRNEALRQLTVAIKRPRTAIDYLSARRSVMRLLQLSVNPLLALKAMAGESFSIQSGIAEAVLDEGTSPKMRAVADHARRLAREGKKTVIWTIFTDSLKELERTLADLNPVSLYGAVPIGAATDLATREGRLARFHLDPACFVMIANPAAAGEGINLHTVCHDAIYLDRSYVSTHYLQSLDRIHRLGLPPEVDTNIHIYQTKAPAGLGSIDLSVSRRLAKKLRNLQLLLDDPDLHELALDEETADEPVDYDVQFEDLVDLVEELEGRVFSKDEAA